MMVSKLSEHGFFSTQYFIFTQCATPIEIFLAQGFSLFWVTIFSGNDLIQFQLVFLQINSQRWPAVITTSPLLVFPSRLSKALSCLGVVLLLFQPKSHSLFREKNHFFVSSSHSVAWPFQWKCFTISFEQ
jgi:hypothetical protein